MNVRYFLLPLALFLSACGSETEVQVASEPKEVAKTVVVAAVSSHDQPVADSVEQDASEAAESVTRTDDSGMAGASVEAVASQSDRVEPLLPLGRLIGVVDSGDYRQATIDNQGKVVRLQEGDDWQGWKVDSISRKKIVISQDNEEYSLLLLSEFRSPEANQHPLANQQRTQSLSDNAEEDVPVPQFTEEQLVELRSRLLMGRAE